MNACMVCTGVLIVVRCVVVMRGLNRVGVGAVAPV